MLTDPPIRHAFKEMFLPAGVRAFDEVSAGYGRADVVTIGAAMHGYEIKSSGDSLSRLRDQIYCYDRVFDTCTLVTTMRHEEKASDMLPDYWGMVVAVPAACSIEINSFVTVREPQVNPNQQIHFLLNMLWRDELREILSAHTALRGCRNGDEMRHRVAEIMTAEDAKQLVFKTLLARGNWCGATSCVADV